MMLSELPDKTQVFLDANIFVYHFGQASLTCKQLLFRCSEEEVIAFTSTAVIAEVLHRRMLIEAVTRDDIRPKNALQQLKEHHLSTDGYTLNCHFDAYPDNTIFLRRCDRL